MIILVFFPQSKRSVNEMESVGNRHKRFKIGVTKVVTCRMLDQVRSGMQIDASLLDARRPNTIGIFRGFVMKHAGQVLLVEHTDGKRAAYLIWEVELLEPAETI